MGSSTTKAATVGARIRHAVTAAETPKQKADALQRVADELFQQVELAESAGVRTGSLRNHEDLLDQVDIELGVEEGTFRQLRESSLKGQILYQQALMSLVNNLNFK